ncbi:MAG: integrase [Oleiphilaceae bacterium]|jgi:integrase
MTIKTAKPLTDKLIKSLLPNKTSYRQSDGLNDPSLKGFHLQVSPSANKMFAMSYTSPEVIETDQYGLVKLDKLGNKQYKRRFLKLGLYPEISLKDAREKARDIRAMINTGIDPVEEELRRIQMHDAKIESDNNRGTVEQLFEYYVRDLDLDGKASKDEVARIYYKDIHVILGHMKTKDVTKKDCALVIKKVVERGSDNMANRVRSYMHAAFNFGIYAEDEPRWMGDIPEFDLLHNPVTQTRRHLKNEKVGERALSKDEVKLLWGTLDHSVMKPRFILAIKILVSTGQRVRQLLEAQWSEFNFDERVWEIPESRNRKGASRAKKHAVILTDFHIKLFTELQRYSSGDYLFPNEEGNAPMDDKLLGKVLSRFCKPNTYYQGFEYFTLRDIRRTWKTLAASIGIDLELCNRIQGDALLDVGNKHYDRYSYLKEKRAGMERYTTWFETVIRGDTNVISMVRSGS